MVRILTIALHLQLFDIGPDGGEQENDGELLAETEEIPYECGPRQKYPMLFEEPIPLQVWVIMISFSEKVLDTYFSWFIDD